MDRKIFIFTLLILAAACKLAEELVADVAGLVGLKADVKESGKASADFALPSFRFPKMSFSYGPDSDDPDDE